MQEARYPLILYGLLLALVFAVPARAQGNDGLINRIEALQAGYPVSVLESRLYAKEALTRFYEARGYTLAWQDPSNRRELLEAIREVAGDGLNPRDYHYDTLAALALKDLNDSAEELQTDLDLVLSDAFLLLASHLHHGKVNPTTIHAEWTANRQQREMQPVLSEALASGTVYTTLQDLKPRSAAYHQLVQRRKALGELISADWPAIVSGPSIRPGDTDNRIPDIRRRLALLGDLSGDSPEASNHQHYDDVLATAIPLFQARHGLEPDGIIGPDTLTALNLLPLERIYRLDANLERWRWLPESLGETYVVVNIAGFELVLVENGEQVHRQRVIVGRPYRQTPVFSDRIRYLVFNPTWTVPRKLMIEDQLPIIRSDPEYLERLGFKVFRGWGANQSEVDPAEIDWTELSKNNFPYQLIQQPGPQNALGQVKFMFPNRYDIYLHDTPAQSLFTRLERTLSSGCIRLERPFELAERLLASTNGWNKRRIEQTLATAEPATVVLSEPVPVYLQYWTTWIDPAGVLQFRNDVYDRDRRLLQALRADSEGGQSLTPRDDNHPTARTD